MKLGRRGNPGGFEQLWPWVLDVVLSDAAFRLYVILRFQFMGGVLGETVPMPSREDLAGKLNCVVRSVDRYLNELQTEGLIGREKQSRTEIGKNFGAVEMWVWVGMERPPTAAEKEAMELQDDLPGLGEDEEGRATPESHGGATTMSNGGATRESLGRTPPESHASLLENIHKGDIHPPKSPNPLARTEAEFEDEAERDWLAFVAAYPIRPGPQGHPEARRKLEGWIRRGAGFTNILEGANRYADYCAVAYKDPSYIKSMGNWLDDQGWKDEIKEPAPKASGGGIGEMANDFRRGMGGQTQ